MDEIMFEDLIGTLMQVAWILFIVVFMFFGQKIQMFQISAWTENQLLYLKSLVNAEFDRVVIHVEGVGKGKRIRKKIREFFLEYVTIIPSDLDPADIVTKIEHIFNVREYHWEEKMKDLAPEATPTQRKNIENVLEGLYITTYLYKMARHFFLIAKKTKSYFFMIQAQMLIPFIAGEMKVYNRAIESFMMGCPIGDGLGPAVAAKIMEGHESEEILKETVMATIQFEGRILYVVKAKGPEGTVGRPARAIRRIIEDKILNKPISMVIMIDAGLMAEGDQKGEILEGVGAAIGGFGNEGFRIEETVTKYNIPIYCWIVKETLKDAVTAMPKEIADSVDIVVARIKKFIIEESKCGDSIIIAGIGNTMGVQ